MIGWWNLFLALIFMYRRVEQLHSQKKKGGRWIWLLAVRMFGFDCNAGKITYTLSALPLNG